MFIVLCVIALAAAVQGQDPARSEVAFSAGLSHNQLLQHAENVKFDKVFTNVGAGYDLSTGVFSCPQSGIYVFQFHMLAQQDAASWLELYHNAYYIASAYGHTANDYAAAGNTVILKLTKGDTVYIKAVDNSYGYDTELYGASDEIYGTFSGYLISGMDQVIPQAGK